MEVAKNENRNAFLDYVKAVAIILVIIQHTWGEIGYDDAIFNYVIRMAVPLFVLVSGYNFTQSIMKLTSLKEWYGKHRLTRKLKAYLMPMIAVFTIWTFVQLTTNTEFSVAQWLKTFITQLYGSGSYYFFIITELYIMFPIVYLISRRRGGGIYG